jgi:hypothetical protein
VQLAGDALPLRFLGGDDALEQLPPQSLALAGFV